MKPKPLKVLVVVDMQNDFITGALGTKEAQEIVPNVVKKIEDEGYDILALTQDYHRPDYLETQEGKILPIPHCITDTNGFELHSDVNEARLKVDANNPTVIVYKSSFGSMRLPEELKDCLNCEDEEMEIKTIELVGLCTDICVISNAMILKAAFPEAEIIVDSSCCAGTSPESHQRALEAMKVCQIEIR